MAGTLGLLQQEPKTFLQSGLSAIDKQHIQDLIVKRKLAREQKDWQGADLIRDELLSKGIELEDGPEGTTWRLLTT